MSSMRYLGMTDIREINRMTFWEYRLRMQALNLIRIDRDYDLHRLAWLIREIQATKKTGKKIEYVYQDWKDFFNPQTDESKRKEKNGNQLTLAQKVAEYARRKRDGEL